MIRRPCSVLNSIRSRIEQHGGNVTDTFFIQTQMKSIISPDIVKRPIVDWINKNNIV